MSAELLEVRFARDDSQRLLPSWRMGLGNEERVAPNFTDFTDFTDFTNFTDLGDIDNRIHSLFLLE
jgi:hypothetical protein